MANLLDRSSLVLTPTAYNNGEALCIKPDDASGDFDFSRNSAATRVNAQGLVENVQILSSNLVQNGDFSEEGVQEVSNGSFSQEGSEEITNGDFENGSTGWALNGWTISNGKANCNGITANLIQSNVGSANKTFKLVFTISNYISGKVIPSFVGLSNESLEYNANGTYTTYISSLTDLRFVFYGNLFNGSIDNVSVREVGQDWLFAGGSEITEQGARINNTITGVNAYIRQNNSNFTIGKSFVLEYDVVATNGTTLAIEQTSSIALNTSTVGNNRKIYFKWDIASTGLIIKRLTAGTDVTITNISVKEVGQNWVLDANWSIAEDKAVSDGTNGFIRTSTNVFESGKTYKVGITVSNITTGQVSYPYDGAATSYISTNGIYETIYTPNTTNVCYVYGRFGFDGDITNISVIEITDDTNLPRINYEGFSYQDALGSELITNGDFATDSDWSKGSGWSISGGTANTDGTPSSEIRQNNVTTVGKQYKYSFTISNSGGGVFNARLRNKSTGTPILNFSNEGTYSGTFTSNGTFIDFVTLSNNTASFSIDNVSVKEYLGQEVVPDSGCGSWLWEPQSTNLITYSEDASQGILSNCTVQSGFVSPSGELTAYKLVEDSSNSIKLFRAINNSATVPNTSYSSSIFVKKGERTKVRVYGYQLTNQNFYVDYDLTDNSYLGSGQQNAQVDGYFIEDIGGNGWKRITIIGQKNASYSWDVGVSPLNDNGDVTYQGDGTSGLYIWGAQLEQQSYATSYIPTNGEANGVTRNQDVCTNGGSLASINSTEGVLYAEIAALADDGTTRIISLSDGTTANRVNLFFDTTNTLRAFITGVPSIATTAVITDNNKVALKFKSGDISVWLNGTEVATSTSAISLSGLSNLSFNQVGSSLFFGKTKCLAVWKEALSDAELTELTTI